jgi:hypothetical protein
MGLQAVEAHPLGLGELRPHRLDHRRAQLGRLLDDEVRPLLLDRREEEPDVRRHLPRLRLLHAPQHPTALARLRDLGQPFARGLVEDEEPVLPGQPHHPEEVMRLVPVEGNGLPLPHGMGYMEPDLRSRRHGTPSDGRPFAGN